MIRMPRACAALVRASKSATVPIVGMDLAEVGDVVAVILERRGVDRHQPEAVDAQLLEVVELGRQADQVAVSVAVGVVESADIDLVEDGILVPEAFGSRHGADPVSRIVQRSGDSRRTTFSASSRGQPGVGSSRCGVGHQPPGPGGDPPTSSGDQTKSDSS